MRLPDIFCLARSLTFLKKGKKNREAGKEWSVDPATCMTADEVREMVRAAETRKRLATRSGIKDWMFTLLGFHTGMRISEIADLQCRHVILQGAIYPHIFVEKGKTVASRRRIPLNQQLIKAILEYQACKAKWNEELRGDEPFLRSPMGGHYTRQGLYMAFRRVLKLANNLKEPKRFHPHSMRHTFATRLYEKSGCDLKMVQVLLGHSRIDTTAQVYVSVFDQKRIEAVQCLYE